MRECCRCASIRDGELSMKMDGLMETLKLPVDNWDSMIQVASLGLRQLIFIKSTST